MIEPTDGCWHWHGGLNHEGYGTVRALGERWRVHRWVYTQLVGPIPDGYDVDHECHNRDASCTRGNACPHRACCNPAHLRAVPNRVNNLAGKGRAAENARKTHCKQGHPFDLANTYVHPRTGGRHCRRCVAASTLRAYHRKRDAERRAALIAALIAGLSSRLGALVEPAAPRQLFAVGEDG